MFTIDKRNKIILTKGDTAQLDIRLYNQDDTEIKITNDDVIIFTLRKNANREDIAFTKQAQLNSIYIEPADTKFLEPGTYVYDIQLKNKYNEIQTIIPISFFELGQEVTR